jgi:signal transduction histidine kinase
MSTSVHCIESPHWVQFYERDEYLLDSLSSFIGTGLRAGEGAVLAATNEHLAALETRLLADGINLPEATRSGKYFVLDAEPTLASLHADERLSPERFKTVIGNVISDARSKNDRVRVFGELVALLCDRGNFEGAIQLEQLWNELINEQPFKLMCAYPLLRFADHTLADRLDHICGAHTLVVPSESYSTLNSGADQERYILSLQQKASALELEIAENKRLHQRLQEELTRSEELLLREQVARRESETANRMKDEFLATVSHELRTPLNAIIGWSNLLRTGRLDAQNSARAVETIERNAKLQAQLVEDLLDVSRMITGKLNLDMRLVDVALVINAAIDSIQLAADAKQISLEVTFEPSARHVLGDASRLQQVVWNLLSNAIKFTPHGGRVEIRLERVKSRIQIKVTDTGQGISGDFLSCVFDRFRQVDGSSTRRFGGLGLGLAIVRHLVELHGGTVAVESEGEGLGSTFIITLPAPAKRRGKVTSW